MKTEHEEYVKLAEDRIAMQARMLRAVREALRPFAEIGLVRDQNPAAPDMIDGPDLAITPEQVRAARKALDVR